MVGLLAGTVDREWPNSFCELMAVLYFISAMHASNHL